MKEKRQKKNIAREKDPVLHIDLVYEVMARLPIEIIFRCAVICKSWYMVTKDPFFLKKVSRLQNKKTHIILRPTLENANELHLINVQEQKSRSIPLEPILHELKVMSSCEGMLSMASTTKLDPAIIYNPLTREKLVLPSRNSHLIISSVFYQQVGIGRDFAAKKFKVLRAFSIRYSSRFVKKYEVFTLGEGEVAMWRRLCSPKCIGRLDEYEMSYCEGSLYFISKPGYNFKVVQFNFSNETFHQVVCQNISPNLEFNFFGVFDDDMGSVFLAIGKENMVGFLKLGNDEVAPWNPIFTLQNWRIGTEWACFNVLTQVDIDRYLVHLGFSDESVSGLRAELVADYCPNQTEFLNCCGYKIWNNPKSYAFKPSFLPLPRVSSPPPRKSRRGRRL